MVARSAALRMSAIGPNPTTAEWRRVITTATSCPPAAAIDTSSRPPSAVAEIAEPHPRRRGVSGLRRLAHPSVVQRPLEPPLSRTQLLRRRSVELRPRELDRDRPQLGELVGDGGRHARHRGPRQRRSRPRPLHPREQVPRAGVVERDTHREVDHVAGVHLDRGPGVRCAERHAVTIKRLERRRRDGAAPPAFSPTAHAAIADA